MPANVIELLQELIRIPSVNPDGDPGTPHVGEGQIAEFIAAFLRNLGAEVTLTEILPGRPNVVARFPSDRSDKARLLLAPHTDTVSVGGMTIDPFDGGLRDEKIWGRGASDTKGSLAAMLWALGESRDLLASRSCEIWFAGLMGEEACLHGSRALAASERFDFVIVGEPTGLQVVNATKGSAWLTLRTRGRAVHASAPELGENALYKMADVLRCIRDEIAPSLATFRHPALGSPTISAGTIRGGTKSNIVPDACEAAVDIRTIPGQNLDPVFERLRAASAGLEIESWQAQPMFTEPEHPVIHALERSGAGLATAAWFCDAASFAERGVPAVALGPGSIAQAHTKDEFLAVADLEAGVAFFKRFLREI
ncbi:MAG: M20 family metallopeptidase [Terrimicrobiaceae bacterium]|nr:M20 family metallopeptidase [Terrimicrobiaceae bacterium]